jgi:hypothetical protein
MYDKESSRQLRSFGLLVGGIFGAIGIYPLLVRSEDPRTWAVVISCTLVIPALVRPRLLSPAYRIWMAAGHALGWINTRIILGLLFYFLVTPLGLLQRLRRQNSIVLDFEKDSPTYRINRKARVPSHVLRQF